MPPRASQKALLCVLLIGLFAAGCNRANGRPPEGATVPTEAPTTTTEVLATPTAPYEVPAVIDEAYVERVMAALDEVLGDAIRILGKERKITEEFLDHLIALYSEDEYEDQLVGWAEEGKQQGFAKRGSNVDDPRTDVQGLFRADSRCIVAKVDRDFSGTVTRDPVPSENAFIALVPKPPGRDPRSLNPTPWVMAFDRELNDASVVEQTCDAS